MSEKKQKIRTRVVILSVIVLAVVLVLIFGAYSWFLHRQKRVLDGFARPNFPFSDYSMEELGVMYPQYVNVDVATTRTPEETHRMFVDKLKAGDLNGAVECCVVKGNQKEMLDLLNGVKSRGQMDLMLGDIEEIKQESMLDTMATYSYIIKRGEEKYANGISFIKNNQGIWLIKSL